MNEVWTVTWFCLAMSDPTCARLEGAIGNMSFDHSGMCELMLAWGKREMQKPPKVNLTGVCWQIGEVYKPLPRPARLR